MQGIGPTTEVCRVRVVEAGFMTQLSCNLQPKLEEGLQDVTGRRRKCEKQKQDHKRFQTRHDQNQGFGRKMKGKGQSQTLSMHLACKLSLSLC
jgi:hypothetical protein